MTLTSAQTPMFLNPPNSKFSIHVTHQKLLSNFRFFRSALFHFSHSRVIPGSSKDIYNKKTETEITLTATNNKESKICFRKILVKCPKSSDDYKPIGNVIRPPKMLITSVPHIMLLSNNLPKIPTRLKLETRLQANDKRVSKAGRTLNISDL